MTMNHDWDDIAAQLDVLGLSVMRDRPLGALTTYGAGGRAACAVTVTCRQEVEALVGFTSKNRDLPAAIIGRGSNLLVSDDGFDGLAVVVNVDSVEASLQIEGDLATADGGLPMPVLARRTSAAGRRGLEWCVGIPGTVGGAVRMNAGGHGAEIIDSIVSADIASLVSGRVATVASSDLGLHFRGSALTSRHLVMSATFRTESGDAAESALVIDEIVAWRRAHQPGGRNAGSVFVNPSPGEGSAGALIDAAGLRGVRVGGARVSDKHANFIQADESCSAGDIIRLMQRVQSVVAETAGVTLRSEVQLLGFDDETMRQFADPRHESADRQSARARLALVLGETR